MAEAWASSQSDRSLGVFKMSARVLACIATLCPSSMARRTIGAVSSVTCAGMMKNVAAAPSRASSSRSAGVAVGFGPSS